MCLCCNTAKEYMSKLSDDKKIQVTIEFNKRTSMMIILMMGQTGKIFFNTTGVFNKISIWAYDVI